MADPASEDASRLAAFLATRDEPCPGCGYNLRGLTGTSCPECKQHLMLHVGLTEPDIGRWLACFVPLMMVGGTFVVVLLVALAISFMTGLPSQSEWRLFILYPVLIAGLFVPPTTSLMTSRGRLWLRRKGKTEARWIVAACVGVSVLAVVTWTVLIVQEV